MIALRARGRIADIKPYPAGNAPRYVLLRCKLATHTAPDTIRLAFTGAERSLPDALEIGDTLDASGPAEIYIHQTNELRIDIAVSKLNAFDGAGWHALLPVDDQKPASS